MWYSTGGWHSCLLLRLANTHCGNSVKGGESFAKSLHDFNLLQTLKTLQTESGPQFFKVASDFHSLKDSSSFRRLVDLIGWRQKLDVKNLCLTNLHIRSILDIPPAKARKLPGSCTLWRSFASRRSVPCIIWQAGSILCENEKTRQTR